jgi:hypothetical protein
MIGNFQDGTIPGKIQYGSGWWFLDQKEGMEWQLNALSNLGLLSRFIGMITDSRSFMSYPRHEYFRRTLCNLIGRDIKNGLIPDDEKAGRPDDQKHLLRQREKVTWRFPAWLPAQMILFLENLWDLGEADEKVFCEEVRTTFLHELGHFFGLNEDDLTERGLE